jgi:hypothetical protein
MEYDVRIEDLARIRPLAVIRRRAGAGELARVVPEACGAVWNVIRAQKVAGAGRHVAVYLDGEINLEIGVELDAPFAGFDEVIGSALPSGRIATAAHLGPYDQLGRAHQAIRDWCVANGHALAGPNWEIYGHWREAWNSDPSQIRTDVYYLLAR